MSLHLYSPLTSNDEPTRLAAAQSLTSELLALLSSERTPATKSSIDYALSRLTKGLASGRDSARPGFAVVLTEFLSRLQSSGNAEKWSISLPDVLAIIKQHTTTPSHATGPEERDYHLGRLFGLQALVQSGVLTGNIEVYEEVVMLLLELSRRKPWLAESCAWTIVEGVKACSAEEAAVTYATLTEAGLVRSSEGVAVWIALRAYHTGVVPPEGMWVPLAGGSLVALGKCLKEAGEAEKGSWNPKVHFVWDFILGVYFDEEGVWRGVRENNEVAGWEELWRVVVDESFFSASSSDERKFHGFTIFTKALEHLTSPSSSAALSALFTKNFMRSFINQLADPSRYLNKAALKCSRALLQKAETEPWCVPVVFTKLITGNGMPNFDHMTKGKTVDRMICFADEEGLMEVMRVLRGIIVSPITITTASPTVDDIKTAEVRRQWAADQILNVVRNGKSVKSESWLKEVVEIFATFGHFDIVGKKIVVPISATSQAMFRGRLLSCLSHLITIKDDTGDETWPYRAVKTISSLQKGEVKYKLAIEVDDVIAEALKRATKTLEKIRKKRSTPKSTSKSATRSSQLSSFELLYSLVILQIYSGETDALGVLDELQLCYDKVVRPKSKKSPEGEDIDASEVMVEILLSFLSKPSVLLRKLAQQVFASFVGTITGRGLEAIFSVLETKESLGGQQELFEHDDEDDIDMDDEGDDEDELDSDVEVVDAEEMDLSDEEDEDSEDEDDDDEDDEDETSETEVSKLEAALSEALGAHKATDDNDSDSDMDDEAMLALDEHLVKIFRQRNQESSGHKSKKQESKHAKETITNFKNRVLDLLDIFAKSQRARDEVTISSKMLIPLLKCIRTTGNKQVAERAAAVIRNYANSLRGKEADVSFEQEEKEELWELLEEIHKEAARDGGVGRDKHKSACSQASLLLMKVLIASGGMKEEDVERAVKVYADSLTKWLTNRSWRVQSGLFTDLVNWAASASKRVQNEGK